MKNTYFLISIFLVLSFAFLTSSVKSERVNTAENLLKDMLQKMQMVEGGEYIFGNSIVHELTPKDTALLSTMYYSSDKVMHEVSTFYLSSAEVTVLDWWEFYHSKVLDIGKKDAVLQYYPDTLAIIREFPYSYNDPMIRSYFWLEKYDKYPVSSVSWYQATEYCEWLSSLFNYVAKEARLDLKLEFRLPNEAEWEAAAKSKLNRDKNARIPERRIFPWAGIKYQEDGKFLANFGRVIDQNGIAIKGYPFDGALYYAETCSYPPSDKGFYDLAGNVAEWVNPVPGYDFGVELENFSAHCKTESEKNSNFDYRHYENTIIHNRKVMSAPNIGLVKGGSWADGLVYLQTSNREIRDKDHKSSRIGFRIAVSDPGEKYRKYFPKNK